MSTPSTATRLHSFVAPAALRRGRCWRPLVPLVLLASIGCQPSPPPSARFEDAAPGRQAPAESAPPEDATTSSGDWLTRLADAAGRPGSASLPSGVVLDGDCTILYPPPEEEIATQAKAIVPLKSGLTLSQIWRRINAPDDLECLLQVGAVQADAIVASNGCLRIDIPPGARRTCRADLRRAHTYFTGFAGRQPETVVGATTYSLSREAFLELKRDATTKHRYLELGDDGSTVAVNVEGTLTLDGTGALTTIVNDAPTELPVLRLSGRLRGVAYDKPADTRVSAAVLDDERFPLVLDYRLLDIGSREFAIRYTKISYPMDLERSVIERGLLNEKRVDVYGIYFDFASDRIRKESEPILKEIRDVLAKNAEWSVSIGGHTDNVGSDADNLDLSRRRSEAVRAALVERYAIAPGRLTTAGYGEGSPKDTNDTPEGRARNRRVELVRH